MSRHSHTHPNAPSHHHHPHVGAKREAAQHGSSSAQHAGISAAEAARRSSLNAQRASSAETMNGALVAWWNEAGSHPSTEEIAGSPLGASMIVTSQFNSFRAAGKDHIHSAMDGALEQNGKPVKYVAGDVPVVATVSGRVLYVGEWDADSGYTVFVGGNDGKIYGYSHLRHGSVTLSVGQRLAQAQPIGMLGHTGNAENVGDCLHYTVRMLDPAKHGQSDVRLGDFIRVEPTIDGVPARITTEGKPTVIAAAHSPAASVTLEAMLKTIRPTTPMTLPPIDISLLQPIELPHLNISLSMPQGRNR